MNETFSKKKKKNGICVVNYFGVSCASGSIN